MVKQMRTWWSRWGHGGAGEDMVKQMRTWWSRWGHGGAGEDMMAEVRTWWSRWGHGEADEDMVEQVRTWWSRWVHGGAGEDMVEQVRTWWSRWEQSKPGNGGRMKTIITREQMWPVFMGDEYDERGESRAAEKVRTGWGRKSVERIRWIRRGQGAIGEYSMDQARTGWIKCEVGSVEPCL
jgi:hypothetical protein